MKSNRAIKTEATRKEYNRVYNNFNLPPQDIKAECSDGLWVRRAWQSPGRFGWGPWEKQHSEERK